MLEGSGKFRRHIKLQTLADLESKHLQDYIAQRAGRYREAFKETCQRHVLRREDYRSLRGSLPGVEAWDPAWANEVMQTLADLEASLPAEESPR